MFKEVDIHCIHQEKHLLAASSDHFTINTSNKISTTHLLTDLTILFPNTIYQQRHLIIFYQ